MTITIKDDLKKPIKPTDNNNALSRVYRVAEGSSLAHYLTEHRGIMAGLTTLGTILPLLKATIVAGKLFDPANPSIVLCSQQLENVFGMKALHVKQLRGALLKQLQVVDPREQAAAEEEAAAGEDEEDSGSEDEAAVAGGPAPTTCSPTTSGPAKRATTSNKEDQKYVMSAGLRALLLPTTAANVAVSFRQAATLLSRYIIRRQQHIFDARNILVALVGEDPLGAVFGGVKAFHRCQTSALLKQQLSPVTASVTLYAAGEGGATASLYAKKYNADGGGLRPVAVRVNQRNVAEVIDIKDEPVNEETVKEPVKEEPVREEPVNEEPVEIATKKTEASKNVSSQISSPPTAAATTDTAAATTTTAAAVTTATTAVSAPRLKRCSDSMSDTELPMKKRFVKFAL